MRIRIKIAVPNSFMEEPIIQKKEKELFVLMNGEIEERITEILNFIDMKDEKEMSYENIFSKFKEKFLEKVLKNAIQASFDGKCGFNVLANTLEMLSEEKLREALMGDTLIKIFVHTLNAIPVKNAFDKTNRGSKIYLLTQNYTYNDD